MVKKNERFFKSWCYIKAVLPLPSCLHINGTLQALQYTTQSLSEHTIRQHFQSHHWSNGLITTSEDYNQPCCWVAVQGVPCNRGCHSHKHSDYNAGKHQAQRPSFQCVLVTKLCCSFGYLSKFIYWLVLTEAHPLVFWFYSSESYCWNL